MNDANEGTPGRRPTSHVFLTCLVAVVLATGGLAAMLLVKRRADAKELDVRLEQVRAGPVVPVKLATPSNRLVPSRCH